MVAAVMSCLGTVILLKKWESRRNRLVMAIGIRTRLSFGLLLSLLNQHPGGSLAC